MKSVDEGGDNISCGSVRTPSIRLNPKLFQFPAPVPQRHMTTWPLLVYWARGQTGDGCAFQLPRIVDHAVGLYGQIRLPNFPGTPLDLLGK